MKNPENFSEEESSLEPREEREIDPELVEKVEGSKLYEDARVNLLLVMSGLKPASEITIVVSDEREGRISTVLSKEDIEGITSILEKSGLPFEVKHFSDTFGQEAGDSINRQL